MATREWKINKLKELGYSIRTLGKNIATSRCICASKNDTEYRGSVANVFRQIFGY